MANGSFSEWRPTSFADEIKGDADLMIRERAGQVATDVIYGSPVDTTAFLANNNFSINSPNDSFDPEKRVGSKLEALRQAQLVFEKLEIGDTFYAVNTAPYGRKLEYGHSKQAPLGIYGIAANNARERGS